MGYAQGSDKPEKGVLDAFSRQRTSEPQTIFDCQFTNDLQPLMYEQILGTANPGTNTITYNTTAGCADINLVNGSVNSFAYMQSYDYIRYQPGKSQLVFITFDMNAHVAGVETFAQLGDSSNYFKFYRDENGLLKFEIGNTTGLGVETAAQSAWTIDKLDGTGRSKINLDLTTTQILVINFQALYVGRVLFGFDIDGEIVWAHEFKHANVVALPYIRTANLPIRVGLTVKSGTNKNATVNFVCSAVISEGGQDDSSGFTHSINSGSVTAVNNTRTHALSVRPKALFNGLPNRSRFTLETFDIIVTGNNAVIWEVVLGQAISGTTAFNDVNTTYSSSEYNVLGTISGSPAIVIDTGFCPATASNKTTVSHRIPFRYPITLDAAGVARLLGTVSILITGVGANSACRVALSFKELR